MLLFYLGIILAGLTAICLVLFIIFDIKYGEPSLSVYCLITVIILMLVGLTIYGYNDAKHKEEVCNEIQNLVEIVDVKIIGDRIIIRATNNENRLNTYKFDMNKSHCGKTSRQWAEIIVIPDDQPVQITAELEKGAEYRIKAIIKTPYPPKVQKEVLSE